MSSRTTRVIYAIGCIMFSISNILLIYAFYYIFSKRFMIILSKQVFIDIIFFIISDEFILGMIYYFILNFFSLGLIGVILLRMRNVPNRTFSSLLIISSILITVDIYGILSPFLRVKGHFYNVLVLAQFPYHILLFGYLIKNKHILLEVTQTTEDPGSDSQS